MKTIATLIVCLITAVGSLSAEDMQGAWIASVFNINFPSKPGLTAATQQDEIRSLLDAAVSAGLNSVFVQVRPESDALYRSSHEPWSRFLTGTQGRDPGYDPLQVFITEAKSRGLEVHAWINPYRAAADAKIACSSSHVSRRMSQHIRKVDNLLWLDPGVKEVRDHIVLVVKEIVTKYDIAGVHFDDYFYPYPKRGIATPFPDDKTYKAYKNGGGRMNRSDWRRDNVNQLIKSVSQTVHAARPGAVFGVSPFGIYTKGQPSDVKTGVDQYGQLFCDSLRWMREGWVDYLSPQLYWTVEGPQSFRSLLTWWRRPKVNPKGVAICPGIAVDRMRSHGWAASEIQAQLELEASISPRNSGGFIMWNIKALQRDTKGVRAVINKF